MNISAELKTIVENLTGHPEYHSGSWERMNSEAEQGLFPVVLLLPFQDGSFDIAAGSIGFKQKLNLAFLDKCTVSDTNEVIEAKKTAMIDMAAEFIKDYNQNENFKPLKEVETGAIYPDKMDVSVTGCIISFTCEIFARYAGC